MQQAQPQWQQQAVTLEGEVLLLRGKLQKAQQAAHAAENKRYCLRARVNELEARTPKGQV